MTSKLHHHIDYADTAESLSVLLSVDADPTGQAIEFQLVPDIDVDDAPTLGSWVAGGSYSTSYNAQRREVWAVTPLIGVGQALVIAPGGRYRLLARPDFGSSRQPIVDCGRITVAGSDAIHGA